MVFKYTKSSHKEKIGWCFLPPPSILRENCFSNFICTKEGFFKQVGFLYWVRGLTRCPLKFLFTKILWLLDRGFAYLKNCGITCCTSSEVRWTHCTGWFGLGVVLPRSYSQHSWYACEEANIVHGRTAWARVEEYLVMIRFLFSPLSFLLLGSKSSLIPALTI